MSIHAVCLERSRRWMPRPPPARGEGDFEAIKGIVAGSGLAILFFWLPLTIAVVHAGN